MPRKIYICRGCDEEYQEENYFDTWFSYCCNCRVEICMNCGTEIKGKKYCPECKPVETEWYGRSVE